MDKARLSEELARRTGLSLPEARRATEAMFAVIAEQLASGGAVDVAGFGRFRARGPGKLALRYGRPAISLRGGVRPKLVLRARGGRPDGEPAPPAEPAGDR